MGKNKINRGLGRVFWGLFFLAAAVAVVLNQAGIMLPEISALKTLTAIFLAAVLLVSLRHVFWTGTFAALMGGALLFRRELTDLTGWGNFFMNTWAVFSVAILLTISFSMLFRRRRPRREEFKPEYRSKKTVNESIETDDVVRVSTLFGGTVRYIYSQNLQKVELKNLFGGQTIYFDNAMPVSNGANVVIDNLFGGIELHVPKSWQIISGLNSFAAGVSEKNHTVFTDNSPILRLSGSQNFAGVEIIYV